MADSDKYLRISADTHELYNQVQGLIMMQYPDMRPNRNNICNRAFKDLINFYKQKMAEENGKKDN